MHIQERVTARRSAVLGRSEVLFEAGDMGVLLKLPKKSDAGLAGENGSLIERPYTIGRWADTDLGKEVQSPKSLPLALACASISTCPVSTRPRPVVVPKN